MRPSAAGTKLMHVLLTNFNLSMRAGTQLYVRDLALGLRARGHQPLVYAPLLGTVATELETAGIAVVDDLDKLQTPPDIIHGNQFIETISALLFFPRTPGVYFCHSWQSTVDLPPVFPRILRYVAVDGPCYQRLLAQGIPKEKASVILNFVDLARFKPRGPLPPHLRRALIFSNYARAQEHLGPLRDACAREAIELDVIGEGVGHVESQPELRLTEYDLVFAKGRAALEAMAVGAAVILCDVWGLGPMVTTREFDSLRHLNFGRKALQGRVEVEGIRKELEHYDPRDAAEVSRRVRATASSDAAIAVILDLYEEAIAEYQATDNANTDDELRAAARYLRQIQADFAQHTALTLRLRNRLLRIPWVGPQLVRLRERYRTNLS